MATKQKVIGNLAESFAKKIAAQRGYTFIMQNYRCYGGELDLILQDGNLLIFLEVRSRKKGTVHPVHTVTTQKQRRLIHAAYCYLQESGCGNVSFRFDLLWVIHEQVGEDLAYQYDYIENVFGISEKNSPVNRW